MAAPPGSRARQQYQGQGQHDRRHTVGVATTLASGRRRSQKDQHCGHQYSSFDPIGWRPDQLSNLQRPIRYTLGARV
jgi:hypothetical protein